jgi:hypothetical protein
LIIYTALAHRLAWSKSEIFLIQKRPVDDDFQLLCTIGVAGGGVMRWIRSGFKGTSQD